MMFGKRVMQPRLTALYGEPEKPFRYSGITMNPIEWNEPLLKIKEKVEKVTKTTFSSALLNLYRDGNDSMGWHRDNEKELGINPLIASVSLGEARPFLVRDYREKKTKIEIELTSGSLLLMAGESQNFWEHCVPKRKRITNSRINITFRNILS